MEKEIKMLSELINDSKTCRYEDGHVVQYNRTSDMNKEYPVSDYPITTPPVPSMTIDDYFERLK
ncbi:MAG TPA: hypothetical protein VMU10_04010 [Desulfomonilia bacterium]|nr:hypothetical protein [Desulfomonilia bacterium]